jgi:hypothetical protein
MVFAQLLCRHVLPGKTSYSEPGTGWGVSVQPIKDESILFFLTDCDEFRKCAEATLNRKPVHICDLLVYCKQAAKNTILLFIELKGSDVKHAAEQLTQTIQTISRQISPEHLKQISRRTLVLATGSAPKDLKDIQKAFFKALGIELKVHSGIKKGASVDLRPILSN